METNPRMIERAVFLDKSDFPLQIPIKNQNDRVYFNPIQDEGRGTKKPSLSVSPL